MDLILASTSFLPAPGLSAWGTADGDVAHVTFGLAKALRALGHRVTIVAPFEGHLAHAGLSLARRLSPIGFEAGGATAERVIFDAKLPSGVELVLLGNEPPGEAPSADDHARRCALFGHAVAAFARQRLAVLGGRGGVEGELEAVVAIGEGAAFVPFAIREDAKTTARDGGPSPLLLAGLARIAVVVEPTADRRLPQSALPAIGVDPAHFTPEGIEFYGAASLLKSAAVAADRVVALGESSRAALLRPDAPHRFDGVMRARGAEVVSIGAGVDHASYAPATDPHVVPRFDADDLASKARVKTTLLAELELEVLAELPPLLVVLGSAPTGATAARALPTLDALSRALRGELVAVCAFAGTPDPETAAALERLVRAHPRRVAVRTGASEAMLRRALAAADLVALAHDDPSGVCARAAMRYGAIPIARRDPGPTDAIVDLDAAATSGTGFLYERDDEAFATMQRAVSVHRAGPWRAVQRRAMRQESGWDRAAGRLARLIQQIEG